MAKESIHDYVKSLNNHLALEELYSVLAQAEALSNASVTCPDFMDQDKNTIHHYMWVLNRLIIEARRCCSALC